MQKFVFVAEIVPILIWRKKLYKYFVDGKLLILKHDIAKINNNLNLIKKIKKNLLQV